LSQRQHAPQPGHICRDDDFVGLDEHLVEAFVPQRARSPHLDYADKDVLREALIDEWDCEDVAVAFAQLFHQYCQEEIDEHKVADAQIDGEEEGRHAVAARRGTLARKRFLMRSATVNQTLLAQILEFFHIQAPTQELPHLGENFGSQVSQAVGVGKQRCVTSVWVESLELLQQSCCICQRARRSRIGGAIERGLQHDLSPTVACGYSKER
jgi:hypothetical protein